MSDNELLPCPFCGCKVQPVRGFDYVRIYGTHGINCPFLGDDPFVADVAEWNTRSGFTAVDMGTAAADGRRSFAEHLIKKNLEEHPDQDTLLTAAYIGMWIASEVGSD